MLLNALGNRLGDPLKRLLATERIWVDIATLEGLAGLEAALSQIVPDRVLFGSHAPFFYAEAAHLKLKESVLTADQPEAIRQGNARRLKRASGKYHSMRRFAAENESGINAA